jgi:hypothetical protein
MADLNSNMKNALAQGETCTTVYGGGTVCGAAYPSHQPINTGWGDVSLPVLILGLFLVSSGLYLLSKKIDLKQKRG